MSIAAMNWAWQQELPPGPKLVLMAMADHADDFGVCWPGVRGVAKKCCMSESTVRRQVKALLAAGLVRLEAQTRPDGGQAVNRYQLQLEQLSLLPVAAERPHPPVNVTPPCQRDTPPYQSDTGPTVTAMEGAPLSRVTGGIKKESSRTKNQNQELHPARPTPPVHHLITYFATQSKARRGIDPVIRGGPAGALVKAFLQRFDLRQGEYLAGWFLDSEICTRKGPSITLCFSESVINQWQQSGHVPPSATPTQLLELTRPSEIVSPEQVKQLLDTIKGIGRMPAAHGVHT